MKIIIIITMGITPYIIGLISLITLIKNEK